MATAGNSARRLRVRATSGPVQGDRRFGRHRILFRATAGSGDIGSCSGRPRILASGWNTVLHIQSLTSEGPLTPGGENGVQQVPLTSIFYEILQNVLLR